MDENEEQPQSIIIIEFASLGSAEFKWHVGNVSPMQMLAAANYLDCVARDAISSERQKRLAEENTRREISRIEVPKGVFKFD